MMVLIISEGLEIRILKGMEFLFMATEHLSILDNGKKECPKDMVWKSI